MEHGDNYLYYLFIYLLNYLCFTFIGVPQIYSKGLGGMELNQKKWTVSWKVKVNYLIIIVVDMYCFYNSVTVASMNFLLNVEGL